MSSKFALVIANTEYQDASFAKLTAPGKDAEEFAQLLKNPEQAAFIDVQVLLNQSEAKTRRAIARFFSDRKPTDLLLLYFSGHGVRNEQGQLFLAANDTEINILEATGIPAEFITRAMDHSRSQRQLLILDCCNSGAFAHGSKSTSYVGKSMGIATAFEGDGYGRVVLTATDATQYAWEGDKVIGDTQKSVFTHFLIEGLKGEADRDSDGRIHVDELYDYAYEEVVRRTPKQKPGKWSYKQHGDIILRENLKPRDVKPAPLPPALLELLSHSNSGVRQVGLQDLVSLLDGKHLGLSRAAEEKLREIAANDDSFTLRKIASDTLMSHGLAPNQLTPTPKPTPPVVFTETSAVDEEKSELEKLSSRAIQYELQGDSWNALQTYYQIKKLDPLFPRVDIKIKELEIELSPKLVAHAPTKSPKMIPWRSLALIVGGTVIIGFLIWGASKLLPNLLGKDSTVTSDKDGMPLLYVEAGEFTMGSRAQDVLTECLQFNADCQLDWFKDEEPPHNIYVDAFWIDQTEVTNKMYSSCVGAGACEEPPSKKSFMYPKYYGNAKFDNYPVIYVDWSMAKTYCEWAGRRLPTEAEWEKAARGTDQRFYPWSNKFDGTRANFCDKSCSLSGANQSFDDRFADLAPVGTYSSGASPYGALDMAGNVWEWVNDWYSDAYYSVSPFSNPTGPNSGQYRVVRGGSWNYNDDDLRTSSRIGSDPVFSNYDLGFRCAQTAALGLGSVQFSDQDNMKLLYVPEGEFTMGGKAEDALAECRNIGSDCRADWHELGEPPHQVRLDAFWIDETEVTNAMYAKCVQEGECGSPSFINSFTHENYFGNSEFDNYPVIYVPWDDANAYCAWAGRRLPTEAEWEKAARGENSFFYPWGNEFDSSLVNFCDMNCLLGWADKTRNDGFADTAPAGNYSKGASLYGALNMVGNVWEWVNDWYSDTYYAESPTRNPMGPESGQFRVLRGGSWDNLVNDVRPEDRYKFDPSRSGYSVGFRCAMSASP